MDLTGWTASVGTPFATTTAPVHTGTYKFQSQALALCEMYQDVSIPAAAYASIDLGNGTLDWSYWVDTYNGNDMVGITLEYYNAASGLISSDEISPLATGPTDWTERTSLDNVVPALTRTVRIVVNWDREDGSNSDAYVDDMDLTLFYEQPGFLHAHVATDWRIASDSLFTDIVLESVDDATNLVSWVPAAFGEPGVTYYAQVRHMDETGEWSLWSTTDSEFILLVPPGTGGGGDGGIGVGSYGEFVITNPTALEPVRGATLSVTVNPTPAGNESWELELSQDYGETFTSVTTGETGVSYSMSLTALTTDGPQYMLRGRMYDSGTALYSDWAYQPFGMDTADAETSGGVWQTTATQRVTDGDEGALADWTDITDEAGQYLPQSLGSIWNRIPAASRSYNDGLVYDPATPVGEYSDVIDICTRVVHLGAEAGWQWSLYYDIEMSFAGVCAMASGVDNTDKSGIFFELGCPIIQPYGDYATRAAGQSDLRLVMYENGSVVHTSSLFEGNGDGTGEFHVYSAELRKVPYYTLRLRVETLQTNADGTRNLRVRAQAVGKGLTAPVGAPWFFDETWYNVNLPAGGHGLSASHMTRNAIYGQGVRQFTALSVWTDWTGAAPVEDPEVVVPIDCPTPWNEKIRYLDRRLDWQHADLSAVYSDPLTTWTVPYEVAIDGSEGELIVVNTVTHEIYSVSRPSTTTVAVTGQGDLSAAPVFVGIIYTFQYEPTTLFLRDREGQVDDRGRLILRYMDVRVHETTDLSITVSTTGRPDRVIILREAEPVDKAIHFAVGAKNTYTGLVFRNATPGGCAITNIEWEGSLTQRNRRI